MPAAVHCSPPGWVCLPSREFSKVSITLQNCFIFHTGFAPCLPYYDFLPLFKSENIFTHILRQLDRCLASALFKSRVHHNQNNTIINYPDIFVFLFFVLYKESEHGSSAESCSSTLWQRENTTRECGVWCLHRSISGRQKTESGEARIKCSGVKLCRGWRYSPPCQHSAVIGSLDGPQSPLKSQRALLYGTVN